MSEPENRCVFHGTSAAFDAFDLSRARTGRDANNALGVFFSDDVIDAIEYADVDASINSVTGRVLVCRTLAENPLTEMDFYDFFGLAEDGSGPVRDFQGFLDMKADLVRRGYDSIAYEDGEQRIFVVFDPAQVEIVASLDLVEAGQLHRMIKAEADPQDDERRFDLVAEIVHQRRVTTTSAVLTHMA